jgi:hypothetical protein
MKITSKSLRCPSSSTSRPCRRPATTTARPRAGLTLLVADGKSPNGPRRPHPSQRRRRRINRRWSSDNSKIPTARRGPSWPHHSHRILDIAIEMGLKPRRLYWRRSRRPHLSATPPNLHPKTTKQSPPIDGGQDPPYLHGPKGGYNFLSTRHFFYFHWSILPIIDSHVYRHNLLCRITRFSKVIRVGGSTFSSYSKEMLSMGSHGTGIIL